MLTSLARKYDGSEWKHITKYLTRQFNYVGSNRYLLTDGSEVEKITTKLGPELVSIVKFLDDGVRIRAANGHKRS
jgi:hypothetical protein